MQLRWCPVRPVPCRTNNSTTTDHCNAPKSSKTHTKDTKGTFEVVSTSCRIIFFSLRGRNIFEIFFYLFLARFSSQYPVPKFGNFAHCFALLEQIYFGEVIYCKLNWITSNLLAQIPASQSVMIFAADRLTFL